MSKSTPAESGQLFKAIDGSHLKWNDFRTSVLSPFGICFSEPAALHRLPPPLIQYLEDHLPSLPLCDDQRDLWRSQVAAGKGFEVNSTLFPPNILPSVTTPTKLQRCLSPRMSREGLPRRSRTTPDHLFELPHARPLLATSFVYDAFSEAEHRALPGSLSASGTLVDFNDGAVLSGRTMPCPFLVFERCSGSSDDDVEIALNMCALAGTQCVRGIQDIVQRAKMTTNQVDFICAFSCAINDQIAVVNCHTINDKGQYSMSALCRFSLDKDDHFATLQVWIQAIEDWAATALLPSLKDALSRIAHTASTPPASPIPSLTLSVDTLQGVLPNLVRTLRHVYPSVKWQSDERPETPVMSSIAHCGTPWEGRKMQSLALGPTSPVSQMPNSALRLRRRQSGSTLPSLHTRVYGDYTPARPSPFSPRWLSTPGIDWGTGSPCRPPTLSPNTPPPDQPWSSKSPMLVLQKRVEIAMDEIQELRKQMEFLQTELATKTKQLEGRNTIEEKTASAQEVSEQNEHATLSKVAHEHGRGQFAHTLSVAKTRLENVFGPSQLCLMTLVLFLLYFGAAQGIIAWTGVASSPQQLIAHWSSRISADIFFTSNVDFNPHNLTGNLGIASGISLLENSY